MSYRQNPKQARHTRVTEKMRHQCPSGKIRYRDRREAMDILFGARIKNALGNENRRERRPYRCRDCRGWHLTSQPYRAGGPRPEVC